MGLFPETIARALAGGRVDHEFLVRFDFTSEEMLLWTGNGPLRTKDDRRWQGLGGLGSVTGLEQAINGQAPETVFTLSGIDSKIMRLAREEFVAEVKGRLAFVAIQFFGVDDPNDPDNQRVLDNPYPLMASRCLRPSFNYGEDGERSVSISAESIFSLRSRPQYAMLTDSDQRRRYPEANDRGFEFVATLINKTVTWPDY